MASTVHYKFKSQKDYDSVGFDGMFISVGDLKKSIVEKTGLARDQACELLLTNAQNDEEYTDDTTMVWKNTSVIVKRVPSMRAAAVGSEQGSTTQKKVVYVRPPEPLPNQPRPPRRQYPPAHAGSMTWSADGAAGSDTKDGNGPDASIAALVNDASAAWETEKAVASVRGGRGGGRGFDGGRGGGRGRGDQSGPPPPGYTCFRCNVPGHWIHQCPTNGDANLDVIRMKTAYGIPQNRLDHVENGVLVAPTGESSELVADDDAFDKMMGFLTDREKAKNGAAALPAPGDEKSGEDEEAKALPAPGDEKKNAEDKKVEPGGDDQNVEGKKDDDDDEKKESASGAAAPSGAPPLPAGPPPASAMASGMGMGMPNMPSAAMDMMNMNMMGMPGMDMMNMMNMNMMGGMGMGMGMGGMGMGMGMGGGGFDKRGGGAGSGKCHSCGEFGHLAKDCAKAVCHKCGKPGHQMRECPESLCHKCGKAGHQVRDCPESSCFKCGGFGHFSKDCPNPQAAKCHRCGQSGHMMRDCVNPPLARTAPPAASRDLPPRAEEGDGERDDRRDEKDDEKDDGKDDEKDDARRDDDHDRGRGVPRRVVVVRKRKSDDFDRGRGRDDDRGRGRDSRDREDSRDRGRDSRDREDSRGRGRDRGPRKRVKRSRGGGGGGGGINSRLER